MQLGNVFQSLNVWQKLCSFRMKPRVAYFLLKYFKLVVAEYDVAEKQRVALIRKLTNTKEGENAEIKVGTPEFAEYAKEFDAILQVDSDLQLCDLSIENVLESVYDEKESVLTVQEIAILEPFFVRGEEFESTIPIRG